MRCFGGLFGLVVMFLLSPPSHEGIIMVKREEEDGRTGGREDGRWAMGDGRWAMGDGRWAMGDGRWAMGGCRAEILTTAPLHHSLRCKLVQGANSTGSGSRRQQCVSQRVPARSRSRHVQ